MNNNDLQSLGMNSEALASALQKLNAINGQIAELINQIKADGESLQGEWETETSGVFFENLSQAITHFKMMLTERHNDFKFLTTTKENYESMEQSIDSLVDTNIEYNPNA